MTITGRPVTALPEAESVTNEDLLVVYKDGVAKRAAASMFRGDPAKINGVNALTLEAGENVTMSQDGDTLRVSAADTTYDAATTSAAGLMSAVDKSKLDGIPADATNNDGTVTGITMNGVSKGTSGVVDLGTVITEHQDISGKLDASAVGAANGVAELDENGKVLASQLPSYVDDVSEYASLAAFPATGESGKIYVATDSNLTYRWSGSAYVEISQSLALGENANSAYRGDRGKIAYDHSQATGNAHNMTKADIGLGNVNNTSDANKPVSTAAQAALDLKVDKISGKGLSTNDYTTAEKDKLLGIEAGAQVNEVTSEHYRSMMAMLNIVRIQDAGFRKRFENFRAAFDNFLYAQGLPVYMNAVGEGVIDIEDAAAGQIHSVTVDSSLSGQRLYVQLSNSTGLTDTTVTVDSDGVALLSLATVKGRNRLYVTTSAYVFPPGANGGHGPHTGGTYVNSHTDENGKWAYDYWLPKNSVKATVRYIQDVELGDKLEITYDDVLAMIGLSVTYSVTDNPAAVQTAGKELYMKMEGYPFGTQAKPIYAKTSYPNAHCSVYYVAEYHQLML